MSLSTVILKSKKIKSITGSTFSLSFCQFPGGLASKESACDVGDLGSIPRLGRSPGEGKDYPFQYSGLENSMECIVHANSPLQLSDFHFVLDNSVNASLDFLLFLFNTVWKMSIYILNLHVSVIILLKESCNH